MNNKKVIFGTIILFALFFGTTVAQGVGFTEAPTYTDLGGDSTPPCTDILKVWIGNNATFLQVKLELNDSLDQHVYPVYFFYIAINNNTGADYGFDLLIDYVFYWEMYPDGDIISDFNDCNNGTNNHANPHLVGLLYCSLSNNNRTIEFGYKLHTADQGTGFLNATIGQTIYLKIQADLDSDLAPDSSLLIRYTLTEESGGIPGFALPFLSIAMLAVIMVYWIAKRKATI